MHIILFSVPLVVVTVWFARVEANYEHGIARSNKHLWPKIFDSRIYLIVVARPEDEIEKYQAIIEKHKNFTDFDQVFAELKPICGNGQDALEYIYRKNRDAYLALTGDAKEFMDQYFAVLWSKAVASLRDCQREKILTREQGDALKQHYDALSADAKLAADAAFPFLTEYVRNRFDQKD